MNVRRPALLVAVLLVLAGCSGPIGADDTTRVADGTKSASTDAPTTPDTTTSPETTTETPTDTPTETTTTTPPPEPELDDDVTVEGDLPIDADLIFNRVEALLGVDADPPTVVVERKEPPGGGDPYSSPFEEKLGLTEGFDSIPCNVSFNGFGSEDEVTIYPGNATADQLRMLLAHEFVHSIQEQQEWEGYDGRTEDSRTARRGVIEGGAVYLADAYAKTYDLEVDPLELRRCLYSESPDGVRGISATYLFGALHFDRRIDSPSELGTVYDDPPETTEQLIHGLSPSEEPPRDLSVDAEGDEWDARDRETYGELFVRTVLRSELSDHHAAVAAEGWGYDVAVTFERGGEYAFAWVLRWDTPADAREFRDTFRTYAERRRDDTDTAFRAVLVDGETVVVFVGPESFVESANASGTGDDVTVAVG